MKTKILLSFCLLLMSITGFSTKWTIINVGFTFSPSAVTISSGDSVNFTIGSSHNAVEVSEATWNANGNTALSGGFETPFGGGLVLPTQLAVGTHYYVCHPHASLGMKGTITVTASNGIADYQQAINFSVYPNPTNGLINIKERNNIPGSEYRITDLSGRQVTRGLLESNTTQVDMNQFSPGVYFIEIVGLKRQSIKVINY
jgi:plastocyanin